MKGEEIGDGDKFHEEGEWWHTTDEGHLPSKNITYRTPRPLPQPVPSPGGTGGTETPRTEAVVNPGPARMGSYRELRLHAEQQERDLTAARSEAESARNAQIRAEHSESDLRDEIGATFRKHGLAAGPTAVDRLVQERDALRREVEEGRAKLKQAFERLERCDYSGAMSVLFPTTP